MNQVLAFNQVLTFNRIRGFNWRKSHLFNYHCVDSATRLSYINFADGHDNQSYTLELAQHKRHLVFIPQPKFCLLYTSDAADEEDSVDLGGRRIIKKKKKKSR
eukprot:TRINITY_DN5289_c0_g1_i3.p1 TRINITY_DN5289_c0_g1~~TRINITY_DN5289_c0_g1_i3.p1  ORF type:complete len:103 (-),score=11.40 TRINITY_DN5289_c0_g1_i3:125-433(-)